MVNFCLPCFLPPLPPLPVRVVFVLMNILIIKISSQKNTSKSWEADATVAVTKETKMMMML